MKTEIKKLPKSELEIEFELTEEEFKKHIDGALLHLKDHMKMDGFRQGQVPLEVVEKKVGQENLLMEAGELAVKKSYSKFVIENNLEPIGQPEVQIKKIAKGSPFLFTVKISVLPEVELPNYKEVASKVKMGDISISEKEIEDALAYIQKSRAKFTDKDAGAEKKDYLKIEYQNDNVNSGKPVRDMFILGESGFLPDFENNLIGMKKGDEKEFSAKFPSPPTNSGGEMHDDSSREKNDPELVGGKNAPNNLAGKEGKFHVTILAVQTMELPEINDDFAKSLGMFDTLVALKSNIKEGIGMEKQEAEKQKRRGEVLSKIAEKIKFELPEKMVELEKERLLHDLKHQTTQQFKISFEDYLKATKKTEEELKNNFRLDAEKRIKNYLVLRQIGKIEHVEVLTEEIKEEMNKFIKSYSKEEVDKIDINQLKEYTKDALISEKIFQLLENLSK